MEFLEVPLYDDDIYKLLVRLSIDVIVLTLVVRGVYYRNSGRKDYLFTYCMVNVLVFFICFTLKKYELGLGMALGLFAIFGILRYRTTTIPIREMTYLFIVIGIAVINALANRKMSYIELAFTNGFIFGLAAVLETIPLMRHELEEKVLYEKIELIRPENHEALIADLQLRTGLTISRVELGEINFLRDTVVIRVFYYADQQTVDSDGNVSRRSMNR